MGKLLTNQKGFGAVEVLLALIFLAIVAFTGVYIAHNHKASQSSSITSKPNTANDVSKQPAPNLTLLQATTRTQTVYNTYEKEVISGQVLQDKSPWATNNVSAAEDLQFINNHKTWFTSIFIAQVNNYKTSNTVPTGSAFLMCPDVYYNNGSAKAVGSKVSTQTAAVTVTYMSGSEAMGGQTTHTIPVTLKPSSGVWVINTIDLSGCRN